MSVTSRASVCISITHTSTGIGKIILGDARVGGQAVLTPKATGRAIINS